MADLDRVVVGAVFRLPYGATVTKLDKGKATAALSFMGDIYEIQVPVVLLLEIFRQARKEDECFCEGFSEIAAH